MNGSRSQKSASAAITNMALQALKNRRKHLVTARAIWQKHLERTESELAELNVQIARMEGQPLQPPVPAAVTGQFKQNEADPAVNSRDEVTFSLNY